MCHITVLIASSDILYLLKTLLSAVIIVLVSEIAGRMPKVGALILSLPIVTVVALIFVWLKEKNLEPIVILSREMFVLVPIGLTLFLPLAFSESLNLDFWPALLLGIIFCAIFLGAYFKIFV